MFREIQTPNSHVKCHLKILEYYQKRAFFISSLCIGLVCDYAAVWWHKALQVFR